MMIWAPLTKSPNWASEGVPVLEPQGGVLRQQRVVYREPPRPQSGKRHELGTGRVVDHGRVAVPEGAPTGVLAGQAHVPPFEDQRPVGERLAHGPVRLPRSPELGPGLEHLDQLGVHGEALGEVEQCRDHLFELRGGHAGLYRRQHRGRRRDQRQRGDGRRGGGPGLVQGGLQAAREVAQRRLGLVQVDVAATDQRLHVQLADGAVLLDQLVQQGLGERRIVLLVVTEPPVAHHVDHHVLVELLAEREGQPGHADAGLGVVTVDVEDRSLDHLGHVGGVHGGPSRLRVGGEPELVVDDQMDGAAGLVAGQG
jgi:hypothetical protein